MTSTGRFPCWRSTPSHWPDCTPSWCLSSTLVSFIKGDPLFLSAWFLLLPGTAAVLAVMSLQRIKQSESTLAGGRLAHWALGIGAVAGLGYITFTTFTGLAIQQQADRFLTEAASDSGFFPKLAKGDVAGAFLLTQPWDNRKNARPLDVALMQAAFDAPMNERTPKGKLTYFLENDVVRLIAQAGDQSVTIEPLGIKDWAYVDKGYKVERNYRVTTPEAVFVTLLSVHSQETGDPELGRKWTVLWGPENKVTFDDKSLTPLGKKLPECCADQSVRFANGWVQKMRPGQGA